MAGWCFASFRYGLWALGRWGFRPWERRRGLRWTWVIAHVFDGLGVSGTKKESGGSSSFTLLKHFLLSRGSTFATGNFDTSVFSEMKSFWNLAACSGE